MIIVTPSADEIVQGSFKDQVSHTQARASVLAGLMAQQSVDAQIGLGEDEEDQLEKE